MKIIQFFLCVVFASISGHALAQGLGFRSTEQSHIENRTSYTVFAERVPKIQTKLIISFELSILDPNSFGFICVVDAEDSNKDYSLAYIKADSKFSHLKLNLKGEENLLTIPIQSSLLGKGKWIKVDMSFNLKENRIEMALGTDKYEVKRSDLNDLIYAQIFFGKNGNIIDVPSFAIRNLTVSNSKEKFDFKFKEHSGNEVHDQQGNAIGLVENPVWLINDSYHWRQRFTYSANEVFAVNYDSTEMKIRIIGKDSLASYDIVKNTFEKKAYTNKLPVQIRLGTSFFSQGKLFVYEVNNTPDECPTIASLDLSSYTWENNSALRLDQQLHHHNAYFNPLNQQLLIFGGFGNNRLSNTFYKYNLAENSWNKLDFTGDVITPRFFAGMGIQNNKLLLFGGVGNKTGDQSIGKTYYFDCYSVDLQNRKITKLWEVNRGDEKLVSARNLVISGDNSSFYALCYPEYIPKTFIKLYKYNIKTGEHAILGDSIPIISEEIQTNANLYLNSSTKELYCIIHEVSKGNSKLSIYSIDNPPISTDELYVNPRNNKKLIYWGIGILFIVGFLAVVLFWMSISRKKRLLKDRQIIVGDQEKRSEHTLQPKKNAVYIFGLFTVFNRNGQISTHLFSPQIKQLFLLILLRSNKGEAGISSEEIYSLMWPDKPAKNAKNLKGVTINKLRTILSDIDGIELILENQHFRFQINESFYCDYFHLISLYPSISSEIDEYNNEQFIEITSRGEFLQSSDNEYFDLYKRDLADQILILVPDVLNHYFSKNEYAKTIAMGSVLYSVDELNECAFYYIINSYLRLGDESSAKKHYNSYILRYKKLQGEDYSTLYPELIKIAAKYLKNVK